jgi:hypothetical protein
MFRLAGSHYPDAASPPRDSPRAVRQKSVKSAAAQAPQ